MRPSSPSTDRARDGAALGTAEPPADDSERGSAALEFILVGLVLLVPIVYLVVTLGLLQAGAMGAEAGARHVARAVVGSDGDADARSSVELVIASVAREYGLDPATVTLDTTCVPEGSACPAAGATVRVTFRARVALPLVPPILGLDRIASIPIEATAVQKISRTWGSG